jgi:hypothetical protein
MSIKNGKTKHANSSANWTQHHMGAHLAIPQVAMEWIVEPG